jgi:hypothetical protein
MDKDDIIRLECIARVMALTVASQAEIQGMIAENHERECNNLAFAYGEEAFIEVQKNLLNATRSQIGL